MLIALTGMTAASAAASDSPVASTACTNAQIGGKSVCLKKGKKCNRHYQGQYLRYGFTCTRSGKLRPEEQGQG